MRLTIALAAALMATPSLAEPLKVTAVHNVLAVFAKRIGGDAVEVKMPVPEGRDPALWKPGIAEISEIQQSDLILLNGAGYADWTAKTSLPRSKTVVTSKAFENALIETEGAVTHSHGPDGEHAHTGTDPHTWLDFAQAAQQAEAVGEALAKRLPEAELDTEALVAELALLDARAKEVASKLPQPLIAAHPRYAYFARAYGLEIVSLDWPAGEDPEREDIAALQELLTANPAKVFLWEAEPSAAATQVLAELGLEGVVFETGALAGQDFPGGAAAALERLAALGE